MFHPDKYMPHNKALDKFISIFNSVSKKEGALLKMMQSEIENFREDGEIIFLPNGAKTLYDFEKRNRYYDTCGFSFKDFGQFERKIQKPEISLSIQCSKDEKCFCMAWHEDFKKEQIKYIGSVTGRGNKEYTGKRFTTAFKELKYSEMDQFYKILVKAFSSNNFNSSCFEI
jgi:hypothetical protein